MVHSGEEAEALGIIHIASRVIMKNELLIMELKLTFIAFFGRSDKKKIIKLSGLVEHSANPFGSIVVYVSVYLRLLTFFY